MRGDTYMCPTEVNTKAIEISTDVCFDNKYKQSQTSLKRIRLQMEEGIQQSLESNNRQKVTTQFKSLSYFAEAYDRLVCPTVQLQFSQHFYLTVWV